MFKSRAELISEGYADESTGEWVDCWLCNGSGEGHADGTRCQECNGTCRIWLEED